MDDFAYENPREMDGEPHEIADFAGQQTEQALRLAQGCLVDFQWATRGAWLTSEYLRLGEMPTQEDWEDSVLAKKISHLWDNLELVRRQTDLAREAASWDPDARLTGSD